MRYFVFALALLGSTAGWAQNGEVSTNAGIDGSVTYFEEEDHPMKMDWDNWTFCWGANSRADTKTRDAEKRQSTRNSGTLESYANVDGPLGLMLVSKLQWDSLFDKNDMVFRVNINRQVGKEIWRENRSTCTTHSWTYKVNKATAKVTTSVQLRVPPNVWVMRIKSITNRSGFPAEISRARALPGDVTGAAEASVQKINDSGYHYFFTRPGEDFVLTLPIDDVEVRDLKLVASFEVTFVGQNRCDQAVREVLGPDDFVTSKDISGRVREAFTTIENIYRSGNVSEAKESLHKATLFIGCMMNRDISDGILFNNDAGQVEALMKVVSEFRNNVAGYTDAYRRAGDAMVLLSTMSLASLQANVLDGVKPYCKQFPLFYEDGKKKGYESGFIKIRRSLKEARTLVGGGFSNYYAQLLETYQPAIVGAASFQSVIKNPAVMPQLEKFVKLYEANNKVLVAHRISGLLAGLPTLKPTAPIVKMVKAAKVIELATGRLNNAFAREFDGLVKRSPSRPSTEGVDLDIRELARAEKDFVEGATKLLKVVDAKEPGAVSSEFVQATQAIVSDNSRFWLASKYQGYFRDFLADIDPDFKAALEAKAIGGNGAYASQTLKEVRECLSGYSSGQN